MTEEKTADLLAIYTARIKAEFKRTPVESVQFYREIRPNVMGEIGAFEYEKPPEEGVAPRWNFALGTYHLHINHIKAASWKLYQMPHCCGICVSCQAEVEPGYRNAGLNTLLNMLRQDIAKGMGFSLLFCTDVEKNLAQRKVLQKNGWKDLYKFVNTRTKNTVVLSCIDL